MRHGSSGSRGLTLLAAAAFLAIASPSLVRAQDGELSIDVVGQVGWPETVAALEHDPRAQGRHVAVRVVDHSGQVAPCGFYALTFDEAGARAFTIGQCDPATSATDLTLVSRTDLFSHDSVVPRPRLIRLAATSLRRGDSAGGAGVTGGAALDCSVGVRPYLDDLEHGTVVYLHRDRFDVRPSDTTITVEEWSDGWSLHGHSLASLTIQYDVVERATGQTVLSSEAILTCSDAPRDGAASGPSSGPPSREPTLDERTQRIAIFSGDDPGRAAEVLGVVDVAGAQADGTTGMWLLRRRAAELHADAVIGVEMHRGTRVGPPRLSGLAVRYLEH
jgi:hypothetical protein